MTGLWFVLLAVTFPRPIISFPPQKDVAPHQNGNNLVLSKSKSSTAEPPENLDVSNYPIAKQCSQELCKLPHCFCSGRNIPGGHKRDDIPQIILITFDDSINDINWSFYSKLFNSQRLNPNGCPIKGTFYVSHEWTDYSCVQNLYSSGHEIASHSISHSNGQNFTTQRWWREIEGERRILNSLGNVPLQDIRGMRAPFLQPGGNNQFAMLHDAGFTYDSTITTGDPSLWPYTLNYESGRRCRLTPCPSRSFSGVWEVPLAMLIGSNGNPCSMADSCIYPNSSEGVANVFMKNFLTHYNGNRAPLGLYFHFAWFLQPHHREGFVQFVDRILKEKKDAFFVTTSQALEWVQQPVSLKHINTWEKWNCNRSTVYNVPECKNPMSCVLKFRLHDRYVRTCASCPKTYPWVNNINGE